MSVEPRTSDVVHTPAQAAEQSVPPLLVREPVERWLDARGLGAGPLTVRRIGEGHSNVTFLLEREGARLVLRRPPRPPVPRSAHDVLREARVLAALGATAVPVPAVLGAEDDLDVLGVPFYVMDFLDGVVMSSALAPGFDAPSEQRAIAFALVDALVELHATDWRACGLEDFGRPEGYLERQVKRFGGLWERSHTRELPELDELTAWLGANVPASPAATVVHGDYRLGNAVFAAEPPVRLLAVLDWEMATLGDPLADLGYLTATYGRPGEPANAMTDLSAATKAPGFPDRAELVARYEERSGRSAAALEWYEALALWKSAIFLEGNYRRFLEGGDDDPFYAEMAEGIPRVVSAARAYAGL